MAGISNHELAWLGPKFLAVFRCEGNGSWDYSGGCPPQERLADYFCQPADADAGRVATLTRPGTMLQAPAGKGYIVLSQLRFDQTIPEIATLAQRLRGLLLTNLGCELKGDADLARTRLARLAQYQYATIDLAPYVNRYLKDDKAHNIIGFANQGESDLRELPTGLQTFAGVPFQIASPKGAVVLYSKSADNTALPKAVKGIRIARHADALFFLHTCPFSGTGLMFKYVIHYEDGTSEVLPIYVDKQVYDWWDEPREVYDNMPRYNAFIAWTGSNPMVRAIKRWGIMLPGWEWANPHPEKVITDIDFQTTPENNFQPVPCLVGITTAVMQADEGVVTGVIDTRGLKVRLGTQEREIYYIGVGGIEKGHWYYDQAVAAHKAMVVGQKVRIVHNVVSRNGAGQDIAYVYLGGDTLAGNLVNGKLLAAGLARLGEFEGNDRLRMYMINLAEPAKWRKVGMWAGQK